MNRNQDSNNYGNNQFDRRQQRVDEDVYRGAYRLDNTRGNEYDGLNHRNFNDRDISRDQRFRDDSDRGSYDQNRTHDYGRDQSHRGERVDNDMAHESNNGMRGASRNFGNMGSYGGAQGWGSSSNGSHQNSSQWASGHGREEGRQVNRQVYGAYRDHNSFAPGEREQYDGAGRYGTQGADASRGWEPSGRAGSRGGVRDIGTNDVSRRGDDSRYEIYDNAQSHYNRGQYGNQIGGGAYMGSGYDRRTRNEYGPMIDYNTARRDHYDQQGEGARSENYGNMAGSLSYGYDRDYRSEEGREHLFDPMSGHIRAQGTQPPSREDFSW